jgi:hypothetical protein
MHAAACWCHQCGSQKGRPVMVSGLGSHRACAWLQASWHRPGRLGLRSSLRLGLTPQARGKNPRHNRPYCRPFPPPPRAPITSPYSIPAPLPAWSERLRSTPSPSSPSVRYGRPSPCRVFCPFLHSILSIRPDHVSPTLGSSGTDMSAQR